MKDLFRMHSDVLLCDDETKICQREAGSIKVTGIEVEIERRIRKKKRKKDDVTRYPHAYIRRKSL